MRVTMYAEITSNIAMLVITRAYFQRLIVSIYASLRCFFQLLAEEIRIYMIPPEHTK